MSRLSKQPSRRHLQEDLEKLRLNEVRLSAQASASAVTISAVAAILAVGPLGGVDVGRDPEDNNVVLIRVRGLDLDDPINMVNSDPAP